MIWFVGAMALVNGGMISGSWPVAISGFAVVILTSLGYSIFKDIYLFHRYCLIILHRRQEHETFWTRNEERIWIGAIVAFISILLTIVGQTLVNHYFGS